ncbi:PREDICTED: protein strawberry notch homolog 1-like, partial [Thamnophis sirtalis]|uniref:Protein strawberry notch homolog 1 n=1 Tax=Thamnophis sirtalis TaxID=35019 RepID=A0A6I9YER6_9SAUR
LPNGDRAGFLIGDGAGVGKGRTIAGIIYENYLLGRKRAVWFSVSNDLKYDAERDLRDIGAKNILVHSLNKFKYGKISSKHNGSVKKGVIFATYSSLIGESQSGGKYKTRLKQLLHWCGDDFDGVIVFDECHKAKNLCPVGSSKPTKTGLAVLELQNKLPKARVIYASATGASEPRNMAYMNRLGIWGEGTPFREFSDFIQAVERRGVGAMEIVAMDMKLRGMYIARQLSFSGVTFKIDEVHLSQHYVKMYNKSVKMWVSAREKFQQAADLIDAEQRMKKSMWGQFWSAHQRFFKYLCIASKVKRVVQLAREEIKNGKVSDLSSWNDRKPKIPKENTLELRELREEMTREVKKARKTGGLAGSSSDESFSESEASENEESDNESSRFLSSGDDDDFNPFRDESSEDDEDDPWLIRKEHKKNKEKKKKKSIDPDSIQSALLASGLGSKRPSSLSSTAVTPPTNVSGKSPKEGVLTCFGCQEVSAWQRKVQPPSTTTFVLNQINQLPTLGTTLVMSKTTPVTSTRQTITVAKIIQTSTTTRPSVTLPVARNTLTTPVPKDQIQLKDLLKNNSLNELMKLKPPPNIAPPVATAATDMSNGAVKKETSTKEVTRIWVNDLKMRSFSPTMKVPVTKEEEEPEEEDEEEMGHAETYAEYMPIKLKTGLRHPDPVVETSSLSSVTPPEVWYKSSIPEESIDSGWLSALQLEAITYAAQQHETFLPNGDRAGFLIGDGAGVGKGRTIAGIIYENYLLGRKRAVWFSVSNDLKYDAERDLRDIGAKNILVHSLNKYGRNALEIVMKSIVNLDSPLVSPPADYPGEFFKDVRQGLIGVGLINVEDRSGILTLDKDYNNIGKFLNRILGMEVHQQNALFQYFSDTLNAVIHNAKKNGRYDMGILDLGSGDEKVRKADAKKFLTPGYSTSGHVELYTISVERGMSWEEATKLWSEQRGPEDGFYLSLQIRNSKKTAILMKEVNPKKKLFLVYRPNTGKQLKLETYSEIKKKYKKVSSDDAVTHWVEQYTSSADTCTHAYW